MLDDLVPLIADALLQALDFAVQVLAILVPFVLFQEELLLRLGQQLLRVLNFLLALPEDLVLLDPAFAPAGLGLAQTLPAELHLIAFRGHVAVVLEPLIVHALGQVAQALVLLLQLMSFAGQILFSLTDAVPFDFPLVMEAATQPAIKLGQPAPFRPEFFLVVEHFSLGLGQVAGDLGNVLLVSDAVLLQGAAFGLGPFVQGQDLAAFFLEMVGQLLFLALQGGLALQQTHLFLAQGDLLGGHRGGLQPYGVTVAGRLGTLLRGLSPSPSPSAVWSEMAKLRGGRCRRNWKPPMVSRSPSFRATLAVRSPLTKVPLPLSRSRMIRPVGP